MIVGDRLPSFLEGLKELSHPCLNRTANFDSGWCRVATIEFHILLSAHFLAPDRAGNVQVDGDDKKRSS